MRDALREERFVRERPRQRLDQLNARGRRVPFWMGIQAVLNEGLHVHGLEWRVTAENLGVGEDVLDKRVQSNGSARNTSEIFRAGPVQNFPRIILEKNLRITLHGPER